MPKDAAPLNLSDGNKLLYYTLPMALNYQRNSYTLWESAKTTFEDESTRKAFDINFLKSATEDELRPLLLKYKVALQPNKHTQTWLKIGQAIAKNWGSLPNLLESANYDFLQLQKIIQVEYKKEFPYLSGPKIFHYWCYILQSYCNITLTNAEYIEIAPDTHVTKCSIRLGVITEEDAQTITKEKLSAKWREILRGTRITPIDMHSPLWFWSRNGFIYELPKND